MSDTKFIATTVTLGALTAAAAIYALFESMPFTPLSSVPVAAAVVTSALWPQRVPPRVKWSTLFAVCALTLSDPASGFLMFVTASPLVALASGEPVGRWKMAPLDIFGTSVVAGVVLLPLIFVPDRPWFVTFAAMLLFVVVDRTAMWTLMRTFTSSGSVTVNDIMTPNGFLTGAVGTFVGATLAAAGPSQVEPLAFLPVIMSSAAFGLLPWMGRPEGRRERNFLQETADFAAKTHSINDPRQIRTLLAEVANQFIDGDVRVVAGETPDDALGEIGKLILYRWWIVARPSHRDVEWEHETEQVLSLLVTITKPALENASRQQSLRDKVERDKLTGALSREGLDELVEESLLNGERLGLLFIDLDKFKPVNDKYGHAAGDDVLKQVVQRISWTLRETEGDEVARPGGDEFIVLLRNFDSNADAESIGHRIVSKIKEPMAVQGELISIGASIGMTVSRPEDTPESLVKRADDLMYDVKNTGRGRLAVAE